MLVLLLSTRSVARRLDNCAAPGEAGSGLHMMEVLCCIHRHFVARGYNSFLENHMTVAEEGAKVV